MSIKTATYGFRAAVITIAIMAGSAVAADLSGPSIATGEVSFATAKWNPDQWTPIRLPHQKTLRTFIQRDESLGTEKFPADEIKAHLDNVLLMADTGTGEGEFEVVFSLSEEKGTAPGIFLSPVLKDGVLDTSLAIFVASYTMAVWSTEIDPVAGETKYKHLVRMNRWNEPNRKHVLRCRYSKSRSAVLIRLDQADTIMIKDIPVNSRIGIWGCHGPCDFYSVSFIQNPVLEWAASDPNKK
ncbi:MAG: hypothetical protein IT583_07940 [Verrucomicrobia bacterium]|nr:hypothetical protein [Verrucomicrobiota bacterium]